MKLIHDFFYWIIMAGILTAFGFFLIGMAFLTAFMSMGNWIMSKFVGDRDDMNDRNGHTQ